MYLPIYLKNTPWHSVAREQSPLGAKHMGAHASRQQQYIGSVRALDQHFQGTPAPTPLFCCIFAFFLIGDSYSSLYPFTSETSLTQALLNKYFILRETLLPLKMGTP